MMPRITTISEGYHIDNIKFKNRRAVMMTTVLNAGVDLTQFENDYDYSANQDMLFVERGSRLDVWLYLAT
jgi:hypothetical protein